MLKDARVGGWGARLIGIGLALGFVALILLATGAPPFQAISLLITGAFGSTRKIVDVIATSVPLLLATSGLLITFAAGLWNIGIEGQITLGAIFTVGALRLFVDSGAPPGVAILVGMIAGMIGGGLWAALAGLLKIYGGVNEIFSGLGLNFVATSATIWLIFGPWRRPGVGSMSGTEPLPPEFALPQLPDMRISAWAVLLSLLGIALVYILLRGTYIGLKLKATGRNARASFVLGIPTSRYTLVAFVLCGLLAGLAGAVQVTAVYNRLIPSISSGYGFLGLLVAMLINYQVIWAIPVALFYAALIVGSIQLPIQLRLDSSLAGVLQGALVLFVLIIDGVRQRLRERG
ncbi:MAG: ABC transporter permease [Anaerolineae bacterium]|nr:ABC transporter permease [Anaerolineae bacterium]NUQ05911.1 ABC transporter permease [Anaerolineae bacterium]